jgi:hypothetical protein
MHKWWFEIFKLKNKCKVAACFFEKDLPIINIVPLQLVGFRLASLLLVDFLPEVGY